MSPTVSRDRTWSMHRRAPQSRVQMVVIWVRASLRGWTSVLEGLKGCQKPPDLHNPTSVLSYEDGGRQPLPAAAAGNKTYSFHDLSGVMVAI